MPATTRRTLHYFWLVTRSHFGLFAGLVVSTLAYVALLSYANPYLMSMVVDQVSANPLLLTRCSPRSVPSRSRSSP